MKKLLLILLALMLCAAPALAAELPLVVDEADVLTDAEENTLTEAAQRVSDAYETDVVIYTISTLGGKTPEEYADDTFDYNGYGQGDDKDGLLFVISMDERKWAISTHGSAIAAFTDYGQKQITDDVRSYLSDDDYSGGFARFIRDCEMYLQQAATGEPYDVNNPAVLVSFADRLLGTLPFCVLIGIIVTVVAILVMLSGMKTARRKFEAGDYVRKDSMNVRRSQDIFLYRTTTRTKIERNDNGSGGSSTHVSSSGETHGGSSGSF